MKTFIISEHDLAIFLSYVVSCGFIATCINKTIPNDNEARMFMFRLNRPLTNIDFRNIKNNATSFDVYKVTKKKTINPATYFDVV